MTLPPDDVLDRLRSLVGDAHVLRGADAVGRRVDPRSMFTDTDAVVVRPASTDEVADVVRACGEHRIGITPLGGNTGLSGGTAAVPARPTIALSLERLDRIVSVDPARWTITAQAGVAIERIQAEAAAVDRQFAPDWGARGTATVGGAIATDAGGTNVLRYGNMRDHVLGIEVVLPDGRVWDGRRALRKDSSGYDLKQLVIGAEGTLGIVTSAVLRLVPATPHHVSALAALASLDEVLALLDLAQSTTGGTLSAFELVPAVGIDRVHELYGTPKPTVVAAEHYALIRLAGDAPVEDRLTALLGDAVERGLVTDAVVAATPQQAETLWFIRDELSPSRIYRDRLADAIKLDMAVPIDAIPGFIRAAESATAEHAPASSCFVFGHVGDGNLHFYVLPPEGEVIGAGRSVLETAIDTLVFDHGGTLSAEHGVGTLLLDRIRPQKADLEWDLMQTVKQALDPDGIMNPGVLFPAG